jgi:hypothetical protein
LNITPDGFPASQPTGNWKVRSSSTSDSRLADSAAKHHSEPGWLHRLRRNSKEPYGRPLKAKETEPATSSTTSLTREPKSAQEAQYEKEEERLDGYSGKDAGKLTWTNEPTGNFSDWAIAVVTGWSETDTVETYYVHKTVVGIGHRASDYFLDSFQKGSTSNVQGTTIVELERRAAKAFPDMLDYIYDFNGKPLKIKTTTAVSLLHLAKHFGVRSMIEEAHAFIQDDLSKDKAHIYLKGAQYYKDDKLSRRIFEFVARELGGSVINTGQSTSELSCFKELLSRDQQLELYKLALRAAGRENENCLDLYLAACY